MSTTPPPPLAGTGVPIDEIAALLPDGLVERLAALAADLDPAYANNTKRAWRARRHGDRAHPEKQGRARRDRAA